MLAVAALATVALFVPIGGSTVWQRGQALLSQRAPAKKARQAAAKKAPPRNPKKQVSEQLSRKDRDGLDELVAAHAR